MHEKSYIRLALEHCRKNKNIKTIDVDSEYKDSKLYKENKL